MKSTRNVASYTSNDNVQDSDQPNLNNLSIGPKISKQLQSLTWTQSILSKQVSGYGRCLESIKIRSLKVQQLGPAYHT